MSYSPVEGEILRDLRRHGADVPANIAVRIERHPRSVSRSIRRLKDRDLIEDKGAKVPVYQLTEQGAREADGLLDRDDEQVDGSI